MKITLAAAILVGLWLASPQAAPVAAQSLATDSPQLRAWRQNPHGISTDAARALYRFRSNSPAARRHATTPTRRYPTSGPLPSYGERRILGSNTRFYYAIPAVGYTAPGLVTAPGEPGFEAKPFARVRPAPNAIHRYWPLLMEGREDPTTGLVIWQLP